MSSGSLVRRAPFEPPFTPTFPMGRLSCPLSLLAPALCWLLWIPCFGTGLPLGASAPCAHPGVYSCCLAAPTPKAPKWHLNVALNQFPSSRQLGEGKCASKLIHQERLRSQQSSTHDSTNTKLKASLLQLQVAKNDLTWQM